MSDFPDANICNKNPNKLQNIAIKCSVLQKTVANELKTNKPTEPGLPSFGKRLLFQPVHRSIIIKKPVQGKSDGVLSLYRPGAQKGIIFIRWIPME